MRHPHHRMAKMFGAALRLGLVAAALSGLSQGAAAQAPADRCIGSADEAALLACRKAEMAEADRQLKQALDKLRSRFQDDEPKHWTLLDAAQRAWSSYAQAECRFRHRESAGGAGYPAYLLSCQTELTRQRLQALQGVLDRP